MLNMQRMQSKPEISPLGDMLVITGAVLEAHPVTHVDAEVVEAGGMAFPREGCRELVRPGARQVWIVQADLPARVEAEEIRRLRHNAIMRSLFVDNWGDTQPRTPWQLWAIIGICLVFLGWSAVR